MTATTIQSTRESRPIRGPVKWLISVEKVLLIRPSKAAARQRSPSTLCQNRTNPAQRPCIRPNLTPLENTVSG
jgi:hypothetical protein